MTTAGLNVCNINGDNARLLTAKTDGNALCVDNTMNRIYWTAEDGVWFLPLVQSSNNATTDSSEQLNNIHAASLASDPTPRYCLVPHY